MTAETITTTANAAIDTEMAAWEAELDEGTGETWEGGDVTLYEGEDHSGFADPEALDPATYYDMDGDGYEETRATDDDGDGVVESLSIDYDGNGNADSWLSDTDDDGVLDHASADTDGEGGLEAEWSF